MSSPPIPPEPERPEILEPDAVFRGEGPPVRPPLAPAPLQHDPPWSGWDVVRIVLVAVVAIVVCSSAAISIARAAGMRESITEVARDPRILVPAQTVAYLCIVLFMFALVRNGYDRPFWRGIHWRFPHNRWPVFLAGGIVLAMAIQLASNFLPIPKQLPIDEFFRNATDAWLMALFGTLLAPLVEELFFRGFLYPVLARRMGMAAGVVITSLLFALIHAGQLAHAWAPLLMLFCVGVALTVARALTDSVATGVLIHMGYNATLFVIVWVASDHFRHLEKIAQ